MRSVSLDYQSYEFNRPLPYCEPNGSVFDPNLHFALRTCTFHVEEATHGYVVFRFTYSGNVDYLSVCFIPQNGQTISVSATQNGLYLPSSASVPVNFKILDVSNPQPGPSTFYVVVNSSGITDTIDVNVNVGTYGTPPSDVNVTINYGNENNTCVNPIYSYVTGLHVYSPYDAQGLISKLRTILYSFTPIINWGINTVVYNSGLLNNPALPWYYGYGDYVYKVGGPFDRAYGYYVYYHIWKNSFSSHIHQDLIRVGPQWWIQDPTNEPYHANCVNPIMTDLGLIKVIYLGSTLDKPKQYRYYMGYDSTSSVQSNNEVFTIWDWNTRVNYPLIGSQHALLKLRGGIIEGYRFVDGYASAYQYDYNPYGDIGMAALDVLNFDATTLMPIVLDVCAGLILAAVLSQGVGGLSSGGGSLPCPPPTTQGGNSLPSQNIPINPGTIIGVDGGCTPPAHGGNSGAAANVLVWICIYALAAVLAIAVLAFLVLLFSALIRWIFGFRKDIYEDCLNIRHFFCDTPYVSGNTNTTLFRNLGLSNVYYGFHNDGCYFYNQIGGRVTSKTQNYIPAGWYYQTPSGPVTGQQWATLPDVPTLVTDFDKLTILCYTSGKPLPFCGGRTIYYNIEYTHTITVKEQECCDLELCRDIVITIPSGTTWSCVSQEDANNQALLLFNYEIEYALTHHVAIALPSSAYGDMYTRFTHELKIENNPTYASVIYDARISTTPRVGMKLYYDGYGCTLAMDGYYAVTGDTTNTPYRTFYHTTNGIIDNIQTMATLTSTTTNLNNPILTNNLEYSSNWYLTEADSSTLTTWSNVLVNERHFNPNVLYTGYTYTTNTIPPVSHSYTLKKGFIKTPITYDNFQLYTNFNTTTYSEAPYGWYKPLIEWMYEPNFLYTPQGRTLSINVTEMCGYIDGTTGTRGVYITCLDSNNVPTGPDIQLYVTIKLFDSSGGLLNSPGTQCIFVQGQSTQFFPLVIPRNSDINSIIITSIITNGPSTTSYVAGTTKACTIKICNQTWLTYDLDTTYYNNGDPIPEITDDTTWSNLSTGAWSYFNNSSSNNSTYGKLYNWYAVNDPRGLAPRGWHIPSEDEFAVLSSCLGGDAISGGKLKEIGTIHWSFPNTGANNLSNFYSVPGGIRLVPQSQPQPTSFMGLTTYANYWTNRQSAVDLAYYRYCSWNTSSFVSSSQTIKSGMSVRCIKD